MGNGCEALNTNEDAVIDDDVLNDDVLNDDVLNDDVLNDDVLNDDVLNDDILIVDILNNNGIKDDVLNDDSISDDGLNKDVLNNDGLNDDVMSDVLDFVHLVRIRRLVEADGEALRNFFADNVFCFGRWAWPILRDAVICVKPWGPVLLVLVFVASFCYASSLAAAIVVTASYGVFVWVQCVCFFLFDENLSGSCVEIMMMTAHLWNAKPRAGFWVAELKTTGDIVGAVGVVERSGEEAEIVRAGVSHSYQRRGLGTRLLTTAIQFCQENQYEKVWAKTCELQPAAMRLLESMGFKEAETWLAWTTKVWYLPYSNVAYRKRLQNQPTDRKGLSLKTPSQGKKEQ